MRSPLQLVRGWIRRRRLATTLAGGGAALALALAAMAPPAFWWTPDQRGMRLVSRGQWEAASERFADSMWRGVALFEAGRFEDAALEFARVDSAEGAFDRGNALVMAGRYDEAVTAYDEALERRPGWEPAETNREIARVRAERLRREGGDMTGGKLGADDIQVSEGSSDPGAGLDQVDLSNGEQLDDASLQSLWLRRLQTSPADFLRSKFARQAAREER